MKKLFAALVIILGFCASVYAQQGDTIFIAFDSGAGIASGKAIQLANFKLGAKNPLSIGSASAGAGIGKPEFGPITFYKTVDTWSPQLFLACALGKHIQSAMVTVYTNGVTPVFEVALGNVYITSVNDDSTNDEGGIPLENFSVTYSKIGWKYIPQGGQTVQSAFDVVRNTPISFNNIGAPVPSSTPAP